MTRDEILSLKVGDRIRLVRNIVSGEPMAMPIEYELTAIHGWIEHERGGYLSASAFAPYDNPRKTDYVGVEIAPREWWEKVT